MHGHPAHNFKKRRRGYLCNFMKGSHGIKRLYGGAGRGYGGGGRICPDFAMTKGRPITMSVCNHD